MLKRLLFLFVFGGISAVCAQEIQSPYRFQKRLASRDTVKLDSVSLNPAFFKVLDRNDAEIDTAFYKVDFSKATLVFRENAPFLKDSVRIRFLKLPEHLTKEYTLYDRKRLVNSGGLYQLNSDPVKKFIPFDGLNTSGSITRGVTVGNNQNAVVNSSLDLQITGKISDKVALRASIQDTNIPLQEGGYSQKLDEFDQIFIELFSERWNIRAGDLFLENRKSRFLNFNKKVQGLAAGMQFGSEGNKTTVYAAAALVRGQYARSSFTGQEGNQGPYKLQGPNGELYILVVSGSERVYANGVLLKRGENNDYLIDYNAGEIIFTSLFPITSEMRINVEYQYSDKNYTRFVTYGGASHERKDWDLSGYIYSENDIKNQPLQQSLSPGQVAALVAAGDDSAKMTAASAYLDSYSENKILYKKTILNGTEIFEYSNDATQPELYNVRFTNLGANLGNYTLQTTTAAGRIFVYVAPIGGVRQGSYEPVVKLIAPVKLQVATLMGNFHPDEKTKAGFEIGLSNSDQNLFSPLDDGDNQGMAGKFDLTKRLFTGKWRVDGFANYQFIQEKFKTVERLFNIEFNRDWNLTTASGDQSLLVSGVNFQLPGKSLITYEFEMLDLKKSFSGRRHVLEASANLEKWTLRQKTSYLDSDGDYAASRFFRNQTQLKYHVGKNWMGATSRQEDNSERIKTTGALSALSQKFSEVGAFIGRGDSTQVFVETGYLFRVNDSLQDGLVKRVNRSDSYYLKSRLIKTQTSDLSVFAHYRRLRFEEVARKDEPSLNARIQYSDRYFKDLVAVTTAYETFSGSIAQQEFSYVEVEPGQGLYAWNDYNGNGIQELQEFEVALFPDLAKYLRVFLPNQVYLKTHQNKFSQALTLNPGQWQNASGYKKFLSHFYDQASFMTERKAGAEGRDFDLNPFASANNNLLGLSLTLRNSLFLNRGKQHWSWTYTYLQSKAQSLLSVGSQENGSASHQLQWDHLLHPNWLLTLKTQTLGSSAYSENYAGRNYRLRGGQLSPKISYLFSKNASLDFFYEYKQNDNVIGAMETLRQQRIGSSFSYTGAKKFTTSGEFSFYDNAFSGETLSAVAYQMLEGLQPGQNMTWRLLLQKTLTQFLDINVNYQGRKSETANTIHTGSIQLRAYF